MKGSLILLCCKSCSLALFTRLSVKQKIYTSVFNKIFIGLFVKLWIADQKNLTQGKIFPACYKDAEVLT